MPAGLRRRLAPPEDEVGDGQDPGRIDDRHRRRPGPLPAPDLAGWPALDVDERGDPEGDVGSRHGDEQPAVALAQIAPLFAGRHGILRVLAGVLAGLHLTSVTGPPPAPPAAVLPWGIMSDHRFGSGCGSAS